MTCIGMGMTDLPESMYISTFICHLTLLLVLHPSSQIKMVPFVLEPNSLFQETENGGFLIDCKFAILPWQYSKYAIQGLELCTLVSFWLSCVISFSFLSLFVSFPYSLAFVSRTEMRPWKRNRVNDQQHNFLLSLGQFFKANRTHVCFSRPRQDRSREGACRNIDLESGEQHTQISDQCPRWKQLYTVHGIMGCQATIQYNVLCLKLSRKSVLLLFFGDISLPVLYATIERKKWSDLRERIRISLRSCAHFMLRLGDS